MTNPTDVQGMIGCKAVDSNGDKVGTIAQIYVDDQTGQPQWLTITTGLFGNKESFAPLQGARRTGDEVQLAVTKDQVKDAPSIDADGHLEDSENDALFAHYEGYYGATGGFQDSSYGGDRDSDEFRTEGRDVSGRTTDDAMTRSEERLQVGTERVESGRARLRKYVVTENVTQTVPVTREEVRVEREPITDANVDQATSGAEITEAEHEVTLHADRPVVGKETVPVERVRLSTDTVTDNETVSEEVRKEQIEEPQTDVESPR